jgi:hypothetical protein
MRSHTLSFLALSLCAAFLNGCGSDRRDGDFEKQLRSFASAYTQYTESQRVSPSSLEDLKSASASFPLVRDDIQAGLFLVVWGASLEKDARDNDRYVLGYEVDVPERGGIVLLGGGTVRHVSAEEFARLGRFRPQGKQP